MKKHILSALALLAVLLLAACAPATMTEAPTAQGPAAAPQAATPEPLPVAPAASAGTATVDTRPTVPAPATDGARPLADIPAAERNERFSGPAPAYIKPGVIYLATIVTDKGNIVAELYQDTPQGLNNFVTLALNGFYDGLIFHRVVPNFVIQGGDPLGEDPTLFGQGGPGYTIPAEIGHPHIKGALAWARTSDEINPERASSGSQFYITLDDVDFLDEGYSVFGNVIEGLDVTEQIAQGDRIIRVDISTATTSLLPTPGPTRTPRPTSTPAPTNTPTVTPTPYAPTSQEGRPLAQIPVEQRANIYNTAPALILDTTKTYQATIETDKGNIVVDLDALGTPNAVNNFVLLANLGYYDGMPVAYAVANSPDEPYAVLGSPGSDPSSHVGYNLAPEISASEVVTGSLVSWWMQDLVTGDLLANGSQFAIFKLATPKGDTPISVFGKVTTGMDVVTQLVTGDIVKRITISVK